MKSFIQAFCQGIYDAMQTNPQFIQRYTVESIYTIVSKFVISFLLRLFTLILGVFACVLASNLFIFSFSSLFWLWILLFMIWCTKDPDLKEMIEFIKEVSSMK